MRLFRMEIVPDERMIPVVLNATQMVAQGFFKDDKAITHITLALEEAIANITEYCLSDSLQNIAIETQLIDNAFIVTVTDKGLPGELDKMLVGEKRLGLSVMNGMVDRVSIENLGAAGRCQRMVKYIEKKPDFKTRTLSVSAPADPDAPLTVRPLQKGEAIEVARCIYDEFGFTYVNEIVYYPERFWAAIQKGEIYSLVAVAASGEIAAHLSAAQWSILPGVWEMGMGVVKRQYRNAHIMEKLVERIQAHVREEMKLPGFICEPVLYHPYTQKISNKQGFHACGAGLAYTQPGLENTISNAPDIRNSVAIAMAIFKREPLTLYLPKELCGMVQEILGRMELSATILCDPLPPIHKESETISLSYSTLLLGRIVVYRVGEDADSRLHHMTTELKRQKMEVIELFLPLNEPGSVFAYEAAKALGYFCTGFLPMSGKGDMLMMENLLAQAVDYDSMKTVEPFTGLLAQIRSFDPNETRERGESK